MKTILSTITVISVMMTSIFVFDGCKKPQDGINGKDGAKGATGNANVQNISVNVTASQWTYDNLYDRLYYRYYNSSNSQSAVYAYVISGSGEQAMPYYNCPTSNAWCDQYDMATYLFGSPPYIEFQYTNYKSKTTAPTTTTNFYLVIIPPAQRKAHPNVDYKNYEEVKKAFNLKN